MIDLTYPSAKLSRNKGTYLKRTPKGWIVLSYSCEATIALVSNFVLQMNRSSGSKFVRENFRNTK